MSEESLLTTAYQFIQIGETQTAERLLTGLIRKEPRSEPAWLLLAACKRLPEEKEKCLEFVAEINPGNGSALQALGELISGRDADALILRAFEDWQMQEAERRKTGTPIPSMPEVTEGIAEAAEEVDARPVPFKRARTIWLWLAVLLLAAGQALAWLRIWELEAALASAEAALVSAQTHLQGLQTILTEYIVELELLRELVH